MTEDAELLRRYADTRAEDAFAELVRRHLGLVYHAALRQCGGDTHRAEDVAQAVFTDLAGKARKLARRPVLAGWLYTSTRYAAAQAVRTEARRQAREQEAHAMNEILAQSSSAHEPVAEWERLRPVIDDALHALGERDREAVLLRFFEGRAFAEVGSKLSLTEDAARMRVERALDKLRAALGRHGITSTSTALGIALANQAAATAPASVAASVTNAALASVTASGGASALLTFLTMSKLQTGIIVIIAVASLATFTVEMRATRALETEIVTVRTNFVSLQSLQDENDRLKKAVATPNPVNQDAAELARLRQRATEMRARFAGQGGMPVGRPVSQQEANARYRTSPLMTVQGIITGSLLSRFEQLGPLLCFDDAGRKRLNDFIAALPPDAPAKSRSPELLVARVFSRWLWKDDVPKQYSPRNEIPVGADADMEVRIVYASGRTVEAERFSFKRFEDGWSFRPITAAEAGEMIALLNPVTGESLLPPPAPVISPPR